MLSWSKSTNTNKIADLWKRCFWCLLLLWGQHIQTHKMLLSLYNWIGGFNSIRNRRKIHEWIVLNFLKTNIIGLIRYKYFGFISLDRSIPINKDINSISPIYNVEICCDNTIFWYSAKSEEETEPILNQLYGYRTEHIID